MSDDVHETPTRVAKLEQEIAELTRKLNRVFTVLDISTAKEPFLRLMISLDATEAQESNVYDLMGEVDARLSQGEAAMDHLEFYDRVHKIFPGHEPQAYRRGDRDPSGAGWRVGSGLSAPAPQRHEPARPPRRARLLNRLGR